MSSSTRNPRRSAADALEDVAEAVDRLRVLWEGGAPSDPGLRARCGELLGRLRERYRESPALFDPDAIAALRQLSQAMQQSQPAGSGEPARVLREVFGYEGFRAGQESIIDAVLAGRDCVGVMPTGAGKSLTYQIPARLLGGTALVISPLIALMKDQVDALSQRGFRAAFLNSSLSSEERGAVIADLRAGRLELLYAAPEGLEASVGNILAGLRLSMIAVDEAHCISHWGHDFRPAYRNLAGLKQRFGGIPVLALTATATREVTRDIVQQLGMADPLEFRGSFFRPNLRLHAFKKGAEGPSTREAILDLVRARRGQSGIVYCLSRKSVESMAEFLSDRGVRARAYHAGLDAETRTRVQEEFQADEVDVIVATVAFGMGIDKPHIRFVVHRDMPRSIEGYYQEIGRAGRDGQPSDCVLFYSWADVMSYERFAEQTEELAAALLRKQSREMFRFADAEGCRHQRLVGHFGQAISPCKESCDRCADRDLVVEARESRRAAAPAPVVRKKNGRRAVPSRDDELTREEKELFERLRSLRTLLARGRPAYCVFPDATLRELARRRPTSEIEMLGVPGIGHRKFEEYGEEFLALLRLEG